MCIFRDCPYPLGRDLSVTHPPLLIIQKLAHDINTHHVPTECLNFWHTLKLINFRLRCQNQLILGPTTSDSDKGTEHSEHSELEAAADVGTTTSDRDESEHSDNEEDDTKETGLPTETKSSPEKGMMYNLFILASTYLIISNNIYLCVFLLLLVFIYQGELKTSGNLNLTRC